MKKTALTFLAAFVAVVLQAQRFSCTTDEMVEKSMAANPQYKKNLEELEAFTAEYVKNNVPTNKSGVISYTIPLVFHIVHDYGSENISDEQVYNQMEILNEDFQKLNSDVTDVQPEFTSIVADCEIQFRLAKKDPNGNCHSGIDRIYSQETYVGDDGSKLNPWPNNKYLNIWVVRAIGSGAAGYAYYPGTSSAATDGIIILSDYIGAIGTSSYIKSRSLSHEVGHSLNLRHLWGNTNDPGETSNCNRDDNVSDTPNTIGWTSCNPRGESCGSLDNTQNIMEYSFCQRMFTNGQKSRMHAALNSSSGGRNNLWKSSNLIATGTDDNYTPVPCTPIAEFSVDKEVVCTGEEFTFTDESWKGQPTAWNWSFPGGTPSSSTDSMPKVSYATPGEYTVTLTTSNAAGTSSAETKTNYVEARSSAAKFTGISTYTEDFGGTNFADDWTVEDDGGVKWEKYSSAGYNSSESVRLYNVSSSSQSGDVDAFISSGLDLAGMSGSPRVYFKAAYKRAATDDNDGLKVYYSTNCGEKWTVRKTLGGSAMASVTGESSTNWTPSSDADWKEHMMTLGGGASSDNLLLKFEFIAGEIKGNNLFIDAINVFDPNSTTNIDFLNYTNLSIYPNPTENNSSITFEVFDQAQVQLKVVDLLGREVALLENTILSPGEQRYEISKNDGLAPGIYHVQLNVDGRNFSQKLIIQ